MILCRGYSSELDGDVMRTTTLASLRSLKGAELSVSLGYNIIIFYLDLLGRGDYGDFHLDAGPH